MFWRLLRSDWLKLKRSVLFWTAVWIPAGYALLLTAYFASSPDSPELAIRSYRVFIEGWSVLLPMILGVWSGLIGAQEEQAGQFAAMLGTGASRPLIYIGKWSMLAFMTIAGTFLSAAVFLLGSARFTNMKSEMLGLYLGGVGSICLGVLFLVAVHLFLSFAAGLGATIGIGAAGSLMAAIVGSSVIGDAIWKWVPWAWGPRMSQMVGIWMTVPDTEPYVSFIRSQWWEGAAISVAATALAVIGSLFWFQRWEGRKTGD